MRRPEEADLGERDSRWTARGGLAALALGVLALAGAPGPPGPVAGAPPEITVFAAADLALAFREVVPLFEQAAGARLRLVLGSTGQLARQIEHGAPADVFFAADRSFLEDLQARGALIPESRQLYARGRIVLAWAERSGLALSRLDDLRRPEVRRIAIAHPEHAPYGRAAREALQGRGLWEPLRPRLVYGDNVRHALQFVETGAVEAGIAALSVAQAPGIRHALIEEALHQPLDQMAAVVRRSPRPELALGFIHYVNGPRGRPIMRRYGFRVPGEF